MIAAPSRLRKRTEYLRVYNGSRKQFSKQMSYFFALRSTVEGDDASGPARVGLTVGRVLGKAVDRNRIKRRLREAVRHHLHLLPVPVDVILHPRRSVLDLEFAALEREIATIFRAIDKAARQQAAKPNA